MFPVLMGNNTTLLRHWWYQARFKPELVMSEFTIEMCVSHTIQFCEQVLIQCNEFFGNSADYKRSVAPFLRQLMVRSCLNGRVDIMRVIIENGSVRITRSVWISSATRVESDNDSRCLDLLAKLPIAKKVFQHGWWIHHLTNNDMVATLMFLFQHYHDAFCSNDTTRVAFSFAIENGHQQLAALLCSCEHFSPNNISVTEYTGMAEMGWDDVLGGIFDHPDYQPYMPMVQHMFEKACSCGNCSIVSLMLMQFPQMIQLNNMPHNGLFVSTMRACLDCAKILLTLAGHQLHFTQTPLVPFNDPLVVAVEHGAFDMFECLCQRNDISLWVNLDTIIETLVSKAERTNNWEMKREAGRLLSVIFSRIDAQQGNTNASFPSTDTAFKVVRFARKCSDNNLVENLQNSDALFRCIRQGKVYC